MKSNLNTTITSQNKNSQDLNINDDNLNTNDDNLNINDDNLNTNDSNLNNEYKNITTTQNLIKILKHPLQSDQQYSNSIKQVKESFYRECERDGNCLYSAISLSIFPLLKTSSFKETYFSFLKLFDQLKISSIVYETYTEIIEEIIENKEIDQLDCDDLLNFTGYLRLVCSTHAILNSSKYEEFLGDTIEEYCKKFVDPMYQRGGDFEIAVISDALKLKITVVSVLKNECLRMCFGSGNEIKLLHTPDHFEPLYD